MSTATAPLLRFTADDLDRAYEEWGANCGPAALAACLGWHIDYAPPLHLPSLGPRRQFPTHTV